MMAYDENMLDKPSVIDEDGRCAVCGRYGATNKHHVILKGMGGRSKETERRIPLFLLCGHGNVSGCHGKFHKGILHARWRDGWEIKETEQPTKRIEALMDPDGWKPLWGWSNESR